MGYRRVVNKREPSQGQNILWFLFSMGQEATEFYNGLG